MKGSQGKEMSQQVEQFFSYGKGDASIIKEPYRTHARGKERFGGIFIAGSWGGRRERERRTLISTNQMRRKQ